MTSGKGEEWGVEIIAASETHIAQKYEGSNTGVWSSKTE